MSDLTLILRTESDRFSVRTLGLIKLIYEGGTLNVSVTSLFLRPYQSKQVRIITTGPVK